MKTPHDHFIFSPEFQAILAPLQDENSALKQEAQEWKEKYHYLLEQLRLAKQQRFGRSSEAHPRQGELQFDEAESVEEAQLPQEENTVTVTYTRKKPVRRPLPEHLPREVIEHDIAEEDKLCVCGCMKQRIGEEVTEQLDYVPAKLSVIAHVRPKYACNCCDEAISIAPMPSLFLPKSMATPSLVAHAIVSKYEDHLPLYRQEQIWSRLGIEMPRNTVCGWIMAAFEVCEPMRQALHRELIASNYLQADETTAYIKKLYLIEQHARNNNYSPEQRYQLRLQQAKPILDELKIWLDKTIKTTAPQSELGKALDYMYPRWNELTAYLLEGSLEIDNNLIENLIRPFALGRKNWMIAGSPRGAHASALFYSIIATAKANGLNPFDYLKTLFENIRSCKTAQDYRALLPFNLKCPN